MNTYIATNTENGKFYIGSTTNFEWRKYCHFQSKQNYPFQNALRRNPDVFTWEVWHDECEEPVLEQALLDMFYGTDQCYNLNPVAGRPPSQSGRPVSLETRKKQSLARRGRKRSASTKRKISKAMTGNQNLVGKSPCSISGDSNPLNKEVEVVYPDGLIKTFRSTKEAGKLLGVSPNTVATHARNNNTPTKGKLVGFSFRFM
jgi:group I intron endonuclease